MVGVENHSRQVSRRMDITASDKFPAGLRVLAVDDDPTCLMILAQMLRKCSYEVTVCTRATEALSMLREKKDNFDLVISDVYMPDMDGFKLLEQVGLEMDLPVIMTSSHGETSVVMKGVTHGACDYLIKPVRLEELRNIWQHVVRKRKIDASKDVEVSGSAEENEKQQRRAAGGGGASDENDYTSSVNDEGHNWKVAKRRKDDDENDQENEDNSTIKKQRVVWSVELHQQFVGAVNRLGIDKAVPKKILELMGVQGLTRENVASHLQKYRLYLRRLSTAQPSTPSATVPSYGAPSEPLFGSTYNGIGGLGQLPHHAGLLPGGLMNNRPANIVDASVLMHSQAPFYGNNKVVPSPLMNIPPRGLDVDGQISPRTTTVDDVPGLVLPQPFPNNGILGRANGSGANSFHQPNSFAPRPNNSGANLCTAQGGLNGGYHRPLVTGHASPPPFYNNVSSGMMDNSGNKLNTMTSPFGDLTGGLQHQQNRGFGTKIPNLSLQSHLQHQQQQQQQQQQPQPHESFQDSFLGGVLMNGNSGPPQHQPTRFAVEAAAANSGTRGGSYGGGFGMDDSTAESNFPVKVEGGVGGLEGGSESVGGGANNQDDLFSIFFKQVS